MKLHENYNKESKKPMKPGMENDVARGSVVAAGRTGFWAGFPGTSSRADFRGRFATLPDQGRKAVGQRQRPLSGKRRLVAAGFCRIREGFYRIATGSCWKNGAGYRLLPDNDLLGDGVVEFWSNGGRRLPNAELRGKSYGVLRIFPRFSTILRTDQGRNSAILRIFTGRALFLATDETQIKH